MVMVERLSLGFGDRQKTGSVTQLLPEARQRATLENRMEGTTAAPRPRAEKLTRR
jgi:hypothetical protein